MACITCFSQEEANDSIQKSSKFASWTISDAFQAEAGFAGSYWKPTFNIALDKERVGGDPVPSVPRIWHVSRLRHGQGGATCEQRLSWQTEGSQRTPLVQP